MKIAKLLLATSAMLILSGCGGGENTSSSSWENPYKFDVPSGDYMCDTPGMLNKVITVDDLNATITIKTYASIKDLDSGTVYATKAYDFDFKEYQFENKSESYYVYGDRALVFENEDDVLDYGIYYEGGVGGRGDLVIYEHSVGYVGSKIVSSLIPLSQCKFKTLQAIPDGAYLSQEKTTFSAGGWSEGMFYVEAIVDHGMLQVNRRMQISDPNTVVCTLKPLDLFGATCIGNAETRIFILDYLEDQKSFTIAQLEQHDHKNQSFYGVGVFFEA